MKLRNALALGALLLWGTIEVLSTLSEAAGIGMVGITE